MDAIVDESRDWGNDLREKMRSKHFAATQVLAELMNGSKDLINQEKYNELCATSTLRIDSKDLLKDESCVQDFSRLHPKVVDLSAEW